MLVGFCVWVFVVGVCVFGVCCLFGFCFVLGWGGFEHHYGKFCCVEYFNCNILKCKAGYHHITTNVHCGKNLSFPTLRLTMSKISLLLLIGLVALASCQEETTVKEKPFKPPSHPEGDVYLAESFSDGEEVWTRWIRSKATKEGADADIAKYDG